MTGPSARVESVDADRVRHVALLSRLELSESEIASTARDLTQILHHINTLQELDLEGIEPTSHAIPLENVVREDLPAVGLSNEMALENAPESEDGCFRVPQII